MASAAVLMLAVGSKYVEQRRGARASAKYTKWSDSDMRLFIAELGPLGIPLADSLLVYAAESGLDPKASSGIAWGIAQITSQTLKGIGWPRTAREFGALPLSEQIPWVARLQASQIRAIGYTPKSALELYVANFSPKAARDRSTVIYRQGSEAYAKNWQLDRDRKGFIAPSDLDYRLQIARNGLPYRAAIEQMKRLQNA